MCDANSLGQAGLAGQAYGSASGAVSSYYGAKAQRSSLQFQAQMDDINAGIAERTAQSALLAGQRQAQAIDLNTASVKNAQTVGLAANGVDLGQAGAARVLTSTDILGTIDSDTALANSIQQAWGYRTQKTNIQNDALMKRASADSISPWMAGATSALGSGATLASSWYKYKKAGG